jgi:acetolactate synthase-1/2/3 large subunit
MTDRITGLAECLVAAAVDTAFGVSGSGASYQLISALKQRAVRYVPLSHEAVGPVAAGAYALLTGKRAVAVSIKGPGLANMMGGMCAAYLEGYAPICIAENYDDGVGVERMHKRIDQHTIVRSVVDGMYSLLDIDQLPAVLAKHQHATRPLYIDLSTTTSPRHHQGDDHVMATADTGINPVFYDRVAAARKIVVIVGSLVKRRRWEPLVEALKIPVFTTVQAKGTVDELKPNAAGIYTGAGRALASETALLPLADLVVTFGLRNMEILGVAAKAGFFNLDVPHHLATQHDVIVDESRIRDVMTMLADKPAWGLDLIEQQGRQWQDYVNSYDWMPGQVFAALDDIQTPHGLVLDTGTFCTIGEHVWRARPGRDFIGSSNGRNLGLGVPHALGAACARPGLPVFCVLGDGGIRYYMAEIRTIASMQLPICFILMRDGRYGSIACNVAVQPADPDIVEPLGTSWCDTMQAMDVKSGRADNAASFHRLLAAWDRTNPYFIEASFDPDVYLRVADAIRG